MDIIIGAGITGLSYAMFSNQTCLILERENEIGGYCRTTKRNGFVWDFSGHFFHFQDKELKNLVFSEIPSESVIPIKKETKIQYKGELIDYPFQKNIHMLPKEEFIDCLCDLFETEIYEQDYKTFQEMLYKKFGRSISEKFLIPYNEKLYACNLNSLDKDAMGRFFPYAAREEIIRNFRKKRDKSYNDIFVYPKTGAITYINSIRNRLKNTSFRLNTTLTKIFPEKQQILLSNGETLEYRRLISTMPFPHLLTAAGIAYNTNIYSWNKVVVFNLGFSKKGKNRTTHWIYFPEKKYSFYRVGFYDNILGGDKMSLYVEVGLSSKSTICTETLKEKVLADLREAGILDQEQLLLDSQTLIMNPAYVHINSAAMKDFHEKREFLARFGIFPIGRYGSWQYCSIEDNIKEAKNLAEKLNTL